MPQLGWQWQAICQGGKNNFCLFSKTFWKTSNWDIIEKGWICDFSKKKESGKTWPALALTEKKENSSRKTHSIKKPAGEFKQWITGHFFDANDQELLFVPSFLRLLLQSKCKQGMHFYSRHQLTRNQQLSFRHHLCQMFCLLKKIHSIILMRIFQRFFKRYPGLQLRSGIWGVQ